MGLYWRRLPHVHAVGEPHFITFRLLGSLPAGRSFAAKTIGSGEAFLEFDRLLDGGACGPLYLKMPPIAGLVVAAVREMRGWDLHEWVVMANHVHLLVTPWEELSEIMRLLKGSTARAANAALGRTGGFWQQESYDRLVRDAGEFRRIGRYIQMNPVRAGLVSEPGEYRWSSAWRGGLKPAAS